MRKIVAEYGWEIERVRRTSGANDDWYIRRSDGPVRPQNIRYEVPRKTRQEVYARDDWACQLCGAYTGEDQAITTPQCDHKVPAQRGGSSKPLNLQTLCTRCNLKKRQACGACVLPSCTQCPFAYPEHFKDMFVVTVSPDVGRRIRERARVDGMTADAAASVMLNESVT
ncbi:HNH endonuclease [Actinoplanes sp. NPDC049118]|uniref:HNH endonuclease n=1 Tax=Actinoplanes sp. NPDC049118 TaxID=3155769 RepID=UPI0033D8FD15